MGFSERYQDGPEGRAMLDLMVEGAVPIEKPVGMMFDKSFIPILSASGYGRPGWVGEMSEGESTPLDYAWNLAVGKLGGKRYAIVVFDACWPEKNERVKLSFDLLDPGGALAFTVVGAFGGSFAVMSTDAPTEAVYGAEARKLAAGLTRFDADYDREVWEVAMPIAVATVPLMARVPPELIAVTDDEALAAFLGVEAAAPAPDWLLRMTDGEVLH